MFPSCLQNSANIECKTHCCQPHKNLRNDQVEFHLENKTSEVGPCALLVFTHIGDPTDAILDHDIGMHAQVELLVLDRILYIFVIVDILYGFCCLGSDYLRNIVVLLFSQL